jgi:hypothetical protein
MADELGEGIFVTFYRDSPNHSLASKSDASFRTMKSIDNEGFVTVPFPNDEDIVYILCFKPTIESNLIPFYVGESRRGTRRIGDYLTCGPY